jgi:hypothetical protein
LFVHFCALFLDFGPFPADSNQWVQHKMQNQLQLLIISVPVLTIIMSSKMTSVTINFKNYQNWTSFYLFFGWCKCWLCFVHVLFDHIPILWTISRWGPFYVFKDDVVYNELEKLLKSNPCVCQINVDHYLFMFDYIPIIWTISCCCQPVYTHYKTNRTVQKLQIWIMFLLFVLYSCTLKHIQRKNAKNTNLIISLLILTVLCLRKWCYVQWIGKMSKKNKPFLCVCPLIRWYKCWSLFCFILVVEIFLWFQPVNPTEKCKKQPLCIFLVSILTVLCLQKRRYLQRIENKLSN